MTSVRSSEAQPVRQLRQGPIDGRAQPQPDDVRAMKDAFGAARVKLLGKEQPGKEPAGGLAQPKLGKGLAQPERRGEVPVQERAALGDYREASLKQEREARERQDGLFGFTGQAQAQPMGMPAMPAAHVDPSAFAQLLADLWTRENGKGAKEVTVTFGDRAWPATGARLVRNAAGTLDVALLVGDGAPPYDATLRQLEAQLRDAGVALGSLSMETA
ncbi:hypothetical protein FHS95_003909 [Sphingomonas naasensis]|uniref:Flagellar hook-length control protein FliK n=1 Tax=Sphingomonas naasensis TaxID=1344951 RepID=A0A4S1WF69_9SPHN|nr:hypothetical protein [Sphingomonas naasensis]NIJ22194.1 hypothetical protein [Sphingomonas naasensis]TGX40785.1 hypothetical protein E5A74_14990 [Sphingomonas naasensis]